MFVLHVAALWIWMPEAWQLGLWREEIVKRRELFVSLEGALTLLVLVLVLVLALALALAMVMRLQKVELEVLAQPGERGCRFR